MRTVAGIFAAVVLIGISTVAASSQTPINRPVPARMPATPAAVIPVPNPEQYFVPINPCVLFNRNIPANAQRQQVVTGTTGFETQGGTAGGCGIPASATAVALNIVSQNSSADGTLHATVPPGVNRKVGVLGYLQGDTVVGSVTATLGLDGRFNLTTTGGATRVLGYATGYFLPQIAGYLNPDGTLYSATTRIVSTLKLDTGLYEIVIDRDVGTCAIHTNVANGPFYSNGYTVGGPTIHVDTWALDADAARVKVDLYFNFTVHC